MEEKGWLWSLSYIYYLMTTLSAPSGVTRMAGVKAYAPKLATSPSPTRNKQNKNKVLVCV